MSALDPVLQERERLRRRNATIALVAAAVACLVATLLAVRILSGVGDDAAEAFGVEGTGGGITRPPVVAGEPQASTPATPAPAEAEQQPPVAFSSPSRNIGCVLQAGSARCDIGEREWDPGPPPQACTQAWGSGLVVGEAEATVTCSDESALGSEQVLDYGRSVSHGPFVCSSTEAGMRCENTTTNRGFSLSRKGYTLF